MSPPVTIRIQSADFDIAAEIAALTKGNTDIGAANAGKRNHGADIGAAARELRHLGGSIEGFTLQADCRCHRR